MHARKLVWLLIPIPMFCAGFETGVVAGSDGGAHLTNAYPVITRMTNGTLVTAFSVSPKGNPDSYLVASLSSDNGKTWQTPMKVLDTPGMLDADPSILWDGHKLFVYSTSVKVGRKTIDDSHTMYATSDDGKNWSEEKEITLPFRYVVGKRHMVVTLLDGSYAMPFAWDIWAQRGTPARTEGEMDLMSGVLKSNDGVHWRAFGYIHAVYPKVTPYSTSGLCEPAVVELKNGELLMLARTGSNFLYESRSLDNGVTWSKAKRSPLMGHNTPAALWRLQDRPKEIIAIWDNSPLKRYPLSVAISADGGKTWSAPRNVAISDGPQVSYPNITQAADGEFVAVWQAQRSDGGRDVRWARFTRDWVLGQ